MPVLDSQTYTRQHRVIARHAKCGWTSSALVETTTNVYVAQGPAGGRISRRSSSKSVLVDAPEGWAVGIYGPAIACPTCGGVTSGKAVKGRYSEARACDARCEGATGPNCECQCAGANHGRAHG